MDDSILLPAGTVLGGQYEIEGVLGKPGGFGITYRALDTRLGVQVAVKEFFPRTHARRAADGRSILPNTRDDAAGLDAGRARFLEEARLLARYRHPNIVRVRTYFEANGTAYLVMDYLDGAPLSLYLERRGGRVDAATAEGIIRPVLLALRELHADGIVHRDVDPHNIYLTRAGDVVLLDFGAARVAEAADRGATTSVVLKPGYAPYEQYSANGRLGPWTDLYAVGATLYRMLAGRVPPEATARILDDDLVPLAEAAPDTPAPLARAVTWALALRPEHRPQTVEAFDAVLDADDGADDEAYAAPAPPPAWDRPAPAYDAPPPAYVPAAAPAGVPPVPAGVPAVQTWDEEGADEVDDEPRSHAGRWALVVVLFALVGLALMAAWRGGVFGRLGIGGPRAADDSYVVTEGQTLDADVLANDVDPAGGGLRVVSTSTPEGGRLRSTGGVLRYTPREGFFGEDSFGYTLSDGDGRMDSARVVVVVERSAARLRHDELAGSLYPSIRERLDRQGRWLVEALVPPGEAAWQTSESTGACVDGQSEADGTALVLRLSSSRCTPSGDVGDGGTDEVPDSSVSAVDAIAAAVGRGTASARLGGVRIDDGLVQADVYRQGRGDGSLALIVGADRARLTLTLDADGYRLVRTALPEGSGSSETRTGALAWNGSRLHLTFEFSDDAAALSLGNNPVARVRGLGPVGGIEVQARGASAEYRVDGVAAYALDTRAR